MKRRPAHTPPVLAPTAYGCAAAVLGAVLYLVAVQTGSDACMAGALAILLSHIVSLGVALSAFLDEKWRGKAERTHRAARMVHRIARASADRRERITYKRIDQMGRVVATLTLGLPPVSAASTRRATSLSPQRAPYGCGARTHAPPWMASFCARPPTWMQAVPRTQPRLRSTAPARRSPASSTPRWCAPTNAATK